MIVETSPEPLQLDYSELPPGILHDAARFGLKRRVQLAIGRRSPPEVRGVVAELLALWRKGLWVHPRRSDGAARRSTLAVDVLIEASRRSQQRRKLQQDEAELRAVIEAMDQPARRLLAALPDIAAELAKMKAEALARTPGLKKREAFEGVL